MTNYDPDRLNRVEALVESNARSIQALGDHISEMTNDFNTLADVVTEAVRQAAEERAELRQATIGIANLLASLDEDRPLILRRLSSIESKVDRILEGGDKQLGG